jgi:hypothetical protein
MGKMIWSVITALLIFASCSIPPGQFKKQLAPGQMKKVTGQKSASGKHK